MTHPATPKFPSREMIERRMQAKLGYNHEFLTTLLPPLAEAVESLFLTEWRKDTPVTMVREGSGIKSICSECGYNNIISSHNFCPCCGRKIIKSNL